MDGELHSICRSFCAVKHNESASMKEQQRAEAVVETVPEDPSRPDRATDIYLIFDGRRIAKRGKPGTLHAMTSISLEPGLVVRDVLSRRGVRVAGPHSPPLVPASPRPFSFP